MNFKDATERAKAARELFKTVVNEHGGTGAAHFAELYIGHASLKLGEADEAAKAYQSFLDGVSAEDPMRFAGLSGLALAAVLRSMI